MNISIIGIGRMGGALGIALDNAGFSIQQLIVRDGRSAKRGRFKRFPSAKICDWTSVSSIDSDVVILSTADADIPSVIEKLAPLVRPGQIVLHTSGALTSDELSTLRALGCETGSIHPLTSVSAPVSGAGQFEGSYFCVEGSRKASAAARRIVKSLGGNAFTVERSKKALYHAAAVMAAGHVTALFDCSLEMLANCGISRRKGAKILLPLVKSTIANLENKEPGAALTGTFARLDEATFQKHLEAFDGVSKETILIYLLLGERSLAIAEQKSRDTQKVKRLRRSISIAKESLR